MKIELWMIGKDNSYMKESIAQYAKRIKRYLPFEIKVLAEKKKGRLPEDQIKIQEAEAVLSKLQPSDHLVLLDDKGKQNTSLKFATWLQQNMVSGRKKLVFLIGGAYGFDQQLYDRANEKLSLSTMTFSHQLVRVIFLEQLYRAFTIIHNEPYHHS